MKKSKGFTLIELLAVIVVLAVIALIAVPLVLNLVNKAKEGAAEASAYAYVKEVETYMMLSQLNTNLVKLENGKTYEVSKIKYEEVAFMDLFVDRVYAEEVNEIYLNNIIDMKGDKPTSGKVTINENKVSEAKFVVKGYNVYCDKKICNASGKSKVEKKELKIELGSVEATYNSITIPFTVNEDADEDVEIKIHYGTTADLGNEAVCENNKCEITGLTQKTTYYYKVVAKDTFGNEVTVPSGSLESIITPEKEVLCKRAIKLNTTTCQSPSSSYHCAGAGYADGDIITYGRLGDIGKLTSGDAFDCDVDNDSKYEERFYYITDSSNGNAVLIYNYNTKAGIANADGKAKYNAASDGTSISIKGPVLARAELPTTTQWSNSKIIYPTTRAILNQNGKGTVGKYNLPTAFSYNGYAARLLTAQELNVACNMSIGVNNGASGEGAIEKCVYFLENTNFSNNNIKTSGYWLETVRSVGSSLAFAVDGYYRNVKELVTTDLNNGVRPVIEVAKEDIEI